MKIIAEIGSNWHSFRDIEQSIAWCHKLKVIPKLQAFKTELVVNKHRNPKHYANMKRCELNREWMQKLSGSGVFYSVFDIDTLEFLRDIVKPEYYKIASPDCVYKPLVQAVAGCNKPTFMSVGGATLDEIRQSVDYFRKGRSDWNIMDLTLMECNVSYPADCAYLGNLRDRINGSKVLGWGYSDHSTSYNVPAIAVALGAQFIEKHFRLPKIHGTPDWQHSFTPTSFKIMIERIKEVEHHMKTLEHPFECEKENLALARRKGDGKR